jgi:NAD(P)-dependent dehydrogenase (short-subunit alcohol dehydrogenase family)
MQLGLSGKVAMVSGGSRGIGRAVAEGLAQEGCDVVVLSRTVQADDRGLAEAAERTGRRLVACAADLRTPEGIAKAIATAQDAFGRLDILVNNAGDTKRGDFFTLTDQDWQDGFALKFFGYVRLTRAAWPLLKTAQGSVVNIVGVSARTPEAVYAIAASTNAGLLAFTKSMAAIGMQDGVRVNAVNPGVIETDRLRGVLGKMGLPDEEARAQLLQTLGAPRFGAPEDIAAMVAFLVSERAAYVQGALIDVDGGRTRGL